MFDLLLAGYVGFNSLGELSKHRYSLAATGTKFHSCEVCSREAANQIMYDYVNKHRLHIIKVYDDKHDKTYICDNGIRFYINRI
jgi:hypothetical protein